MFKKAILAAAISSIAAPAMSATWVATETLKVTHSSEGLALLAATAGGDIVVGEGMLSLGTEYAQNDLITFTTSVAKGTNVAWPTSIVSQIPSIDHSTDFKINNAGGYAKGHVASMAVDTGTTKFTAGDFVTIATKGPYRINALTNTGTKTTAITITQGLDEAVADNAVIAMVETKKVTLTLTSSTTTSATYRVSAVEAKFGDGNASAATSTVGSLIRFNTPNLDAAALSTAKAATLSMSATTGAGTVMDANSTALAIAATAAQYAYTLDTKFDAQVSVDLVRKSFVGPAQADTMQYDLVSTAGIDGVDGTGTDITAVNATTVKTSLAVTADGAGWDFLDTTAAAGILLDANNSVDTKTQALNTGMTFDATGKIMTITDTAVRSNELITVTKAAGATSNDLPAQNYSSTMTTTYTPSTGSSPANDLTDVQTLAAGAWTLNAASITAYGVPYGDKVARMLWINNAGTTAGEISASFTQAGVTTSLGVLGTAATRDHTPISALVDAALVTAGITPAADSRANVIVTVTSPANDITMSAAYRVIADGDRLTIETSDTVDGTDK